MAPRTTKSSERRRCPQACRTCKRRKERCDGQQPCNRCIARGVAYGCVFSRPLPQTQQAPAPLSSSASQVQAPSPAAYSQPCRSIDIDGFRPTEGAASAQTSASAPVYHHSPSLDSVLAASPASVPRHLSRLIQADRADKGRSLFFLGDSANVCFLQVIRRLFRQSVGFCAFTDDPLQHVFVEAEPNDDATNWIVSTIRSPLRAPSLTEATHYLTWYLRSTDCLLSHLFDYTQLRESMFRWLEQESLSSSSSSRGSPRSDGAGLDGRSDRGHDEKGCGIDAGDVEQKAIFYLVLAIGAQTAPDGDDSAAEVYFNYARYLLLSRAAVSASIPIIQAYSMITMFLLGQSRRNEAFIQLGNAVRAAYALGIHRGDINAVYPPDEYSTRERLWRVLRILDIYLSASMGRPRSTAETRDTKAEDAARYSACLDLCSIFEAILTEVYSKCPVSTATIDQIGRRYRLWTARFAQGLAADNLQLGEHVEADNLRTPNIGLVNLKGAYHWSVMLLTRPFLVEHITAHISRSSPADRGSSSSSSEQPPPPPPPPPPPSQTNEVLTYACINSAVQSLVLHRHLLAATKVPRRQPYVVNVTFVATMVVGLAQLGDFDRLFPLDKSLVLGQRLLDKFGRYDPVARRYAAIAADLQAACDASVECRARFNRERHSLLIDSFFGTVEGGAGDEGLPSSVIFGPDLPPPPPPPPPPPAPAAANSPGPGAMFQPISPQTTVGQADEEYAAAMHMPQYYAGMNPTPPCTDKGSQRQGATGSGAMELQQQQDLEDMGMGGGGRNQMFGGLPDTILSLSPRMIDFDSSNIDLQLFPLMDGSML
ncbi:uncharacterized protein E0L32_011891 [Thyridium curvatum]|uniref:Zn(2)-C6 fungal-type domain-containing protein n=1 Tax=Thyridium curvatum TaxID=1093900 RepID=A0A507B4H6_9PEZI|nr:uncharacterized protein E0L32_011891 [Thyridium curvatum]TPX18025.1 hypothetical protein E0L32_011891 [Thyridium curvatum]